jgi:hypothetical protein
MVTAIAASATALALVTAGCSGGGSKPKASSGAASGGASGATDGPATPDSVATAFLAAWQAGDYKKAASFTDDPAKAEPRLASVMKSLAPKSIDLKLGAATAPSTPTAPPSVTGTATAAAPAATRYSFNVVDTFDADLKWTYSSTLGVIPASGSTPPLVHWSSAVINPQLGAAANLKATPPAVPVADDKGVVLTAQNHPSLARVIQQLSTARPSSAGNGPAPSLQIQFVDNNTGTPIADSTPIQLGVPGAANGLQLASTLDDKIQTAAEQALAAYPESGMVVIQPSTGNVLAIASNSKTVAGLAYHATRAPGSTFKTISAAALLQSGMKPTDTADCTPVAKVGTQNYHNDEGLKNGFAGATLTTAYEQSCNTSFVNSRTRLKGLDALSNEAKNFFGMNQPWDMGVGSATYCTVGSQQVPPADGDERFGAEMFGQGNITMCPLTMASVAATVASGTFKQPVLIPGQQATATAQPLPADVDANLKTLMQGVITNGTAISLQGISPTLGAKTGSAEPNSKDVTDSWMIAMDPSKDVAVAALVLNGGFGNAKAGPAIATMLKSTGL